jgi:TPR repeat protein
VLFEELAARGVAQGAFAMAQTYDPQVLEQMHVVGVLGDVEKAKYWYRKAAELGNIPPLDILSSLKKERPQQ